MDEKSEMIDRIKYLIDKDSKNKTQILRELHLSTSTLSDWEKGKGNPSSSAIAKLAKYFNVTSDYLLFGVETIENKRLTPSESKWLKIYDMFSESERENLLNVAQFMPDMEDTIVLLNYLRQLSGQERAICLAFIRGVLAEKLLKEK